LLEKGRRRVDESTERFSCRNKKGGARETNAAKTEERGRRGETLLKKGELTPTRGEREICRTYRSKNQKASAPDIVRSHRKGDHDPLPDKYPWGIPKGGGEKDKNVMNEHATVGISTTRGS